MRTCLQGYDEEETSVSEVYVLEEEKENKKEESQDSRELLSPHPNVTKPH